MRVVRRFGGLSWSRMLLTTMLMCAIPLPGLDVRGGDPSHESGKDLRKIRDGIIIGFHQINTARTPRTGREEGSGCIEQVGFRHFWRQVADR